MVRAPRFEYQGAVYHVMARGDGGNQIFVGNEDHDSFVEKAGAGLPDPWLAGACMGADG